MSDTISHPQLGAYDVFRLFFFFCVANCSVHSDDKLNDGLFHNLTQVLILVPIGESA